MTIDLRSDAVTRPTEEMWAAMQAADIGWAPSGDDEHVRELEAMVSDFLGKEAGLLVPGGGAANLLAVIGQADRGEQIVVDHLSHILWAEEWGFAFVGGCVVRPVPGERGKMAATALEQAIREHSFMHRPRTALVCLENTHNASGGAVLTLNHIQEISAVARRNDSRLHIDGARLLNASAALSVEAKLLVAPADSVSFNLNKGLSAPWGAVLCGTQSLIDRSRVTMRRLGMSIPHQAGIFAVAGLVAMRTMIDQHDLDNERAAALAAGLAGMGKERLAVWTVDTNIVLVTPAAEWLSATALQAGLREQGVLVSIASENAVRMVTHRHIGENELSHTFDGVRRLLAK